MITYQFEMYQGYIIVIQHMIFQYQLTCRAGTNQLVTLTKPDHIYENYYD